MTAAVGRCNVFCRLLAVTFSLFRHPPRGGSADATFPRWGKERTNPQRPCRGRRPDAPAATPRIYKTSGEFANVLRIRPTSFHVVAAAARKGQALSLQGGGCGFAAGGQLNSVLLRGAPGSARPTGCVRIRRGSWRSSKSAFPGPFPRRGKDLEQTRNEKAEGFYGLPLFCSIQLSCCLPARYSAASSCSSSKSSPTSTTWGWRR